MAGLSKNRPGHFSCEEARTKVTDDYVQTCKAPGVSGKHTILGQLFVLFVFFQFSYLCDYFSSKIVIELFDRNLALKIFTTSWKKKVKN